MTNSAVLRYRRPSRLGVRTIVKPEATGKVGVSQVVRIGAPVALAADIRARYDNIAFGYSSLNTHRRGRYPRIDVLLLFI